MIFKTTRKIAASPSQVFAAIKDGDRLAIWWGPAGFTNSFSDFDFSNGGKWTFIMHGPDGKNYPNENVFLGIVPFKKVVIQHVLEPRVTLTVYLEPIANAGTLVRWEQDFEDDKVAKSVEHIVVPSNEQNLDRLTAEVLRTHGDQ